MDLFMAVLQNFILIACLYQVSIKIMLNRSVFFIEGAILLSAGRPVDCLRQLLIECGGPEAEAVRGYFGLQVRFFSLQIKVF